MIVHIIRRQTCRRLGALAALGAGCAALLVRPQAAATGVSRGLAVCSGVIIPSLFPFLVWTGLFVRSGLAGRCGRRLDCVTRTLFGLSGGCGAAILMSWIGGYPAGAVTVRDLLQRGEIDEKQAKRLLRFCVNAGPAFLIGTVGAGLLGSVRKGVALYMANVLSSFLLGLFGRRQGAAQPCTAAPSRTAVRRGNLVVESVENACSALLSMCGFVVLFAAFLTLSDVLGMTGVFSRVMSAPFTLVGTSTPPWECVYTAFWEVSQGCMAVAGEVRGGDAQLFLLGSAVGWGGLSVHCQIGGILSEYHLVNRGYFVARLWQALLGGVLSAVVGRLLGWMGGGVSAVVPTAAAVTEAPLTVQPVSLSVTASVALLMMCGAVLFAAAAD